jgi:hypothetical protein
MLCYSIFNFMIQHLNIKIYKKIEMRSFIENEQL